MSDRLTVELETRPCHHDIAQLFIRELTVSKLVVACKQCRREHEIGFPKYVTDLVDPSPFAVLPAEEPRATLDVRFTEQEYNGEEPSGRGEVIHARTFTPYDAALLRDAKVSVDPDMLDQMDAAARSTSWHGRPKQ